MADRVGYLLLQNPSYLSIFQCFRISIVNDESFELTIVLCNLLCGFRYGKLIKDRVRFVDYRSKWSADEYNQGRFILP